MSPEPKSPRLQCSKCARPHPWAATAACEACGGLLEVEYDLATAKIRAEGPPLERYFDLLPLRSRDAILDGGEGNTPCFHAAELGKAIGIENLWVKVEGANPTKTTKDRQGSLMAAAFRELGIRSFATASTGNSGTSVARIVSRCPDLHMHLFVGHEFLERIGVAESPNVTIYWVRGGSFDAAGKAATGFATQSGIHRERGFFFFAKREALKTAYLEAVDQVSRPIEYYVQAVSSGVGVHATVKAARDLASMGRIEEIPRVVAVQEESCAPMVESWRRGSEVLHPDDVVHEPDGLSKATLRGNPHETYPQVRACIRASGGTMASVKADAIRETRALALETEGLEICHTSAMTIAAARRLRRSGRLTADAVVLLNLTGRDRVGAPKPRPDFIVEWSGAEWKSTPATRAGHAGETDRSTPGSSSRVTPIQGS